MSISAMTNVAVARRTDIPTPEPVPTTAGAIVEATAGTPETRSGLNSAVQVIITYIPTEILGLYTSIATVIQPNDGTANPQPAWIAFFVCLIMTPSSVWLMYAGKVKSAGKSIPFAWKQWPVWEMFASAAAFAAWAFSMPNSPFQTLDGFYSPGIAAIVLPTTAMFLGLLAPVLQRPLNP